MQWEGGYLREDQLDLSYDLNPVQLKEDPVLPTYKVQGLRDLHPDPDHEEFDALRALGIGMMGFYREYAQRMDDFEVVAAESSFSIPLGFESIDRREESPNYNQKLEVHARGRRDAIIYTPDTNTYGIIDHKAQPLDEPILTPSGYVEMGELEVDDEVIGSNGQPTKIINVFPQEILDCYEVTFSDGSKTRCAADHLWTVSSSNQSFYKKPRVRTTEWLEKRLDYVWSVPTISNPILFESQEVPIHPYLLGLLIGDGYLGGTGVVLSATEQEIIERARETLPIGIELYKLHPNNNSWGIAANKVEIELEDTVLLLSRRTRKNLILEAIKDLGLHGSKSSTKFIPKSYLINSAEVRLSLLQGLMDADGNCYKGWVKMNTASKQLARDVLELVRSLGGTARMHVSWGTNFPKHTISFRMPRNLSPFKLTRKRIVWEDNPPKRGITRNIQKIELVGSEPMQCIQVESKDGLYLTRDCIVTHNTAAKIDEDYFLKLENDPQCSTYIWASIEEAEMHDLPWTNINEVVYNALRKVAPSPPTILKSGVPSINRAEQGTTAQMFEEVVKSNQFLIDWYGGNEKAQAYYEYLLTEGDRVFVQRDIAHRNKYEIAATGNEIRMIAHDMLDRPSIYKNPTGSFTCTKCAFRSPCLAKDDGSDWMAMLADGYELNRDR